MTNFAQALNQNQWPSDEDDYDLFFTDMSVTVLEPSDVLRVSGVKNLNMGFGVEDLKIAREHAGLCSGWPELKSKSKSME